MLSTKYCSGNSVMGCYIGIDLGTSGVKALLMTEKGIPLRTATREYPLLQPRDGWAEQDADVWFAAVCEVTREIVSGIDANSIRAVGLTGQMHGLVCLDSGDKVLSPAILWCDQRTASECAEITEKIGAERVVELTANPMLTGFTAPKILWIRNNEPHVYERIRRMLLPKDYIRYMLTGENASDVSDASGTGLLNVARREWEPEIFDKLEIDRSAFGKLYESCEVAGQVSEAGAAKSGIPAGVPVVAGAGDNAAAAIGTGVVRDGQSFVTIGSSGVVYAHTSEMKLDPQGRIHTFCSAVSGQWHVMGVTLAAGLSLKWFRENFAPDKTYAQLDELAESAGIGANNLLFLPYLNGERSPHKDPDCRGAFIGLSAQHGTADFARAVMEGVTYSLCDCRDIICETGIDIAEITACGGGSVSGFWRGMLCDAFYAKVNTVQTEQGPAFGAAILACVGADEYSDVSEACGAIVKYTGTRVPDNNAHVKYEKIHVIYKSLYPALYADGGRTGNKLK